MNGAQKRGKQLWVTLLFHYTGLLTGENKQTETIKGGMDGELKRDRGT